MFQNSRCYGPCNFTGIEAKKIFQENRRYSGYEQIGFKTDDKDNKVGEEVFYFLKKIH